MQRQIRLSPFCDQPLGYGNDALRAGLAQAAPTSVQSYTGVAVSIHSLCEPIARDADHGGVAPLHHAVTRATTASETGGS